MSEDTSRRLILGESPMGGSERMLQMENRSREGDRLGEGRYLLFDSGCSECTGIAGAVEQESGGWLTARSLRDAGVQEVLSKARPGWKWEPTLLEVNGKGAIAFTGVSMKVRMLAGLGPRRAARVARAARRPKAFEIELNEVPSEDGSGRIEVESIRRIDRRDALKAIGTFGLAVALLPALPQGALAQRAPSQPGASRRVLTVTTLSRRQTRGVFDLALRYRDAKMLDEDLRARGFRPDFAGAVVGGLISRQPPVTAGDAITGDGGQYLFLTVPYKRADGNTDTATLSFSVTAEKIAVAGRAATASGVSRVAADTTTLSGKRLDGFGIKDGRVAPLISILDIDAERVRLGLAGPGNLRTAQSSCTTCRRLTRVITILGCGAGLGTIASIACGGIGGAACAPILNAVFAAECAAFTAGFTPFTCQNLGYC